MNRCREKKYQWKPRWEERNGWPRELIINIIQRGKGQLGADGSKKMALIDVLNWSIDWESN